jgi:hypothetical protein
MIIIMNIVIIKITLSILVLVNIAFPSLEILAEDSSMLFSLNEDPYGISFEEWSAKWWKWLMEIPQKENPAQDPTGMYCNLNQKDKDVWFLAGVFAGEANRKCEIPFGKAILFAGGYECSIAENPNLKTAQELTDCAINGIADFMDPNSYSVKLDGKTILNPSHYKVISPVFQTYLPANNIWGVMEGDTTAVAVSYLVFIKPLSQGFHTFESSSNSPSWSLQSHADFIKYELIIK